MSDAAFEFDVPATTAHLGPGFGALGLALDLRFHVTVQPSEVEGFVVERSGGHVGAALGLRHDAILRALRTARDRWRLDMPKGLAVLVDGDVPRGCGLGSNSADFAIGAGVALRFAKQLPPTDDVLDLLTELGSDPGHGAASLTGGLAIAMPSGSAHARGFHLLRYPVDPDWRFVLVAPAVHTTTADVHRVVPASLPHAIVGRTSARLAGLLRALETGDEALLADCLVDESHVPFRLDQSPGIRAAIAAARESGGAAGATISGHGPAVVALTTDASRCQAIADAMAASFGAHGVETTSHTCSVSGDGALPSRSNAVS